MDDRTRREGTIDEAKGNVKNTVGRATGDERTASEGKLDEVKGNFKQGAADAQDRIEDRGRDKRDQ